MDEEFGGTYIEIEDEDGQKFEIEYVADMEYNGSKFMLCLPADEEDPDYGYIILRCVPDADGEEMLESVDDDDELNEVYERFMALLFPEDEEETPAQ